MTLTRQQYDVLMRPLQPNRVVKRKQGGREFSYLEAYDVRAHLNRIFGFGNWSTKIMSCQLLFCDKGERNWDVSYQVTLSLHIKATDTIHQDGAVGSAHLPDRGEALDMALKTAMSDAIKRCAINWGTQFGLSLYNNGSLADVVRTTLVAPEEETTTVTVLEVPEVVVDETTGEIIEETPGQNLTADRDTYLASLRGLVKEEDSAKRVLEVARIKAAVDGADWLKETTTLPNGSEVTLARLADMVAQGSFLNGADGE